MTDVEGKQTKRLTVQISEKTEREDWKEEEEEARFRLYDMSCFCVVRTAGILRGPGMVLYTAKDG